MKSFTITANAGADIASKAILMQDGTGGVIANTAPGTEIGVAESNAIFANPGRNKVGVIKEGLMSLTAVAATYNFGDVLEVATGGQSLQALGTGAPVATAAESKVLAAPGALKVYWKVA